MFSNKNTNTKVDCGEEGHYWTKSKLQHHLSCYFLCLCYMFSDFVSSFVLGSLTFEQNLILMQPCFHEPTNPNKSMSWMKMWDSD